MRIAHVFKDAYPPLVAGITRYIADVADASARGGHEVEIHVAGVRRSRRDILSSGVVVHRHRELGRVLSSPIAPGLTREVRGLEPDVLHVHMPNPIGELGAAFNDHAGLVATFHAQLGRQRVLEPLYGPLRERLLRRAGVVIASSERMRQAAELARVVDRVRVLPYGVSPRMIAAGSPEDPRRGGGLRLLFVGRLVYYKGLDVLLDALTRTDASTTLTVVGSGPLREELERRSVDLGLSDRVEFLGALSDGALVAAYASHDAFAMPSVSRAEAFGLAMAEAMANGLPAISTALGTGTDWVNAHDESGVVIAPGDPEALAGAIRRLSDPDERARLSTGARRRVDELFSFDRHLDLLLAAYEDARR